MRTHSYYYLLSILSWILLVFQVNTVFGAQQPGPQAELSILDANLSSCFYQAHAWQLSAGLTSSNDTDAVVVVSATIDSSSTHKSLRIAGTLQLKNTGDAAATIGNIALVLQKSFPRVGMVALCADVANAFYGSTATTSVSVQKKTVSDTTICSSTTTDSCTIPDMPCAGEVVFYQDGIYSDIWSISPRKSVAPGETLLLVYETVMDATTLNLTAGDVLRMEALVTFGNVKERCGKASCVASFLDIDGDGTISSDEVYVRTVVLRNTFTLNQSVELFPTATLIDGSQTYSTVNITADLVSVDSPDPDTDTHVITANTNVTMVFHRTDDGTSFGGLSLCGSLTFADAPTMTVTVLYAIQDLVLPCVVMPNLQACVTWIVNPLPPVNLQQCLVPDANPALIQFDHYNGILPNGYLANNFNTLYPHSLTIGLLAYHYANFTNAAALLHYMAVTSGPSNTVIYHTNTVNPPAPLSFFEIKHTLIQVNMDLFPGLRTMYYCPWNTDSISTNWFSTMSGLQVRDIENLGHILISGAPFPSQYVFSDITSFQDRIGHCFDVTTNPSTCVKKPLCQFQSAPCNTASGTLCTIATSEWATLPNSTLNIFRAKLALNPNPYVVGPTSPTLKHMTFHSFDDMLNFVQQPPANNGSSYGCRLSASVDSPTIPPCPLAADMVSVTMGLTLFPKIATETYSVFTIPATSLYTEGAGYLANSFNFLSPAQIQAGLNSIMTAFPLSSNCAAGPTANQWTPVPVPT